jgi:hypothetical protein
MSKVPLLRDVTRLKVVHRQRVNRQGDADPAPLFVAGNIAPDVLGAAADGWQQLLHTEHESVVIAGWMTAALARIGAPLDLIGAFGRVVEDEIRHVDLCGQMVETFGGTPTVPVAAPPPFPTSAATEREAQIEIISGMVGFFCVFEHLSGLVFSQAIEAAEDAKAKWALGEIFRDEAFHGAFGYETAKYYVPRWSIDEKNTLATRVIDDVRRFEQRLRAPLGADPMQALAAATTVSPQLKALESLGLLSSPALLRTFYLGVEKELIPRLGELGIQIAFEPASFIPAATGN